jgi:hypothetical protein
MLSRSQLCERLLLDPQFLESALSLEAPALSAIVARLQAGAEVQKFGRGASRGQRRRLFLTADCDGVGYVSSTKRPSESIVLLCDVDTVLSGQHTAVFVAARAGRHCDAAAADRCLSVVCAAGAPRRSLDVCFDTEGEAQQWRTGLAALLLAARACAEDKDTRSLRRAFAEAAGGGGGDVDAASGARRPLLSITKVPSLLPAGLGLVAARAGGGASRLQELLDARAAEEGAAGGGGERSLSLAGVLSVVDALRAEARVDVARLFARLREQQSAEAAGGGGGGGGGAPAVQPAPASLGAPALLAFLRREQGKTDATEEHAERLCAHWDACHPGARSMCLPSFAAWLTSSSNAAFSPAARARGWCSLRAPLAHYWVEASHNTYLEGMQIAGTSSVAPYLTALAKGCRCVELDCWDGDGGGGEGGGAAAPLAPPPGEPVIYHGHTLTSHVPFRDVVTALARYAFCGAAGDEAAALPLILSLEVHCSPAGQDHLASILKCAFGERLLPAPPPGGEQRLPSPHALRGRVLVKAKLKEPPLGGRPAAAAAPPSPPPLPAPSPSSRALLALLPPPPRFSAALAGVVYLRGVQWKALRAAFITHAPLSALWVSSLKEGKVLEELRCEPARLRDLSRTNLLRVYPGPLRFASSNFNPAPLWAAGVQMTALNYQTLDVPMRIQRAWFAQNGRCGYVLKPRYLTGGAPPPAGGDSDGGGGGGGDDGGDTSEPTPRMRGDDDAPQARTPAEVARRLKQLRRTFEFHSAAARAGGGGGDAAPGGRPSLLVPRSLSFSEEKPPPFTLLVTPLGAANVPLPAPRCVLQWFFSIHGSAGDSGARPLTRSLPSSHGGMCAWEEAEEPLSWALSDPLAATLYVEVHEEGRGGALLAYDALPVCALRRGYRTCQLRGANGKKIPLCTLLAKFDVVL